MRGPATAALMPGHAVRALCLTCGVALVAGGARDALADPLPPAPGSTAPAAAPAPTPRPRPRPPAAPYPVIAGAISDGAVVVRWPAVASRPRARRYEIRRGPDLVGVTTATELIDMGLRPAIRACYTVRAVSAAGRASAPAGPACAVTPDLVPPSAPGSLAAEGGDGEVALRWGGAADDVGVAGYEVLREGRVVAGTPGLASAVKGLPPGTTPCFTVRAFDAAGNRSGPSERACATTADASPPTAPARLEAGLRAGRAAHLAWPASADDGHVAAYEVLRGGELALRVDGAATEADLADPPAGAASCFTVRAVDGGGNRSPPSPEACLELPDLTPPSAPAELAVEPRAAAELALSWAASTDDVGVAGYEVLRGEELVARTTAPEHVDGAAGAEERCYRARAYDAAGNRSAATAPACARAADPSLPSPPWRLRAQRASARAVRLSWEPSREPGVVYRVSWERGRSVGLTRFTAYRVSGLDAAAAHCYAVRAVAPDGRESARTREACVEAEPARTAAGAPRPGEAASAN